MTTDLMQLGITRSLGPLWMFCADPPFRLQGLHAIGFLVQIAAEVDDDGMMMMMDDGRRR